MPFSILLQGYPKTDITIAQVQGTALQGMFLELMSQVDPDAHKRLHDNNQYRPYTLSPMGLGTVPKNFQGFWLSPHKRIDRESVCHLRVTFLEDDLFPIFSRYFLEQPVSRCTLNKAEFVFTGVLTEPNKEILWSQYVSYAELIERASHTNHKIGFRFLTPTAFRRGDMDFPLPDPRLVFQGFRKRFNEFHPYAFLPDFEKQVEFYTGIAKLKHLETQLIKVKQGISGGFTGYVAYELDPNAPPELVFQMNLLADYAFFCGTGRQTAVGMGQTYKTSD